MIRTLGILLIFGLLAWNQPSLATAQRGRTIVKSSSSKTAPRTGVRTKSAAKSRTAVRPRSGKATGFARLSKNAKASVTLRSSVRTQTAQSKAARKDGHLSVAAAEASRSPLRNANGQFAKGPKKVSIRERFALWRATRAVKRTALKQAGGRSAQGDLQGTADALQALNILEAKGKLGAFGRWQKARATKRAFANTRNAASRALKSGDVEQAGQSFAFAAGLRPGSRQAKKMAAGLVKESFQVAAGYAKAGNGQLTWNVLEMAAAIAAEGGTKFSEKKAQKLVEKAFVNALPVLTKSAQKAYGAGDLDQAVALLAEARAIERTGTAKPGRGVAKKQKRLALKLGARLAEFEQAQAAAAAQ